MREEILKQFEQEQEELLNEHRKKFIATIPQKIPLLLTQIVDAFNEVAKQTEIHKKEKIVFFHFSLLRCDLLTRKYHILLQVQDIRWFLDPHPIEMIFSVDFLYQDLNDLWDLLLEKRKKYIGKINSYDVNFMMTEEAIACDLLLGEVLRYSFRDVEANSNFAAIPKEVLWDIRWGEFRGVSVLTARVDRTPKTIVQWKAALQSQDESGLNEMYWYQIDLIDGDCSQTEVCFTVFEECLLKNISFKSADLTGTSFIKCRIENCDFDKSVLDTTYFEDCHWQDTSLKTAIFKQTVTTAGGIATEELEESQIKEILVKEV